MCLVLPAALCRLLQTLKLFSTRRPSCWTSSGWLRTLIGSPAARLDGIYHRVSEVVDKDGCEPDIGLFCRGKISPNRIIAQAVGVWISTWESNKLLEAGLGGYTIHWCSDDPKNYRRGRQLYCRATNMDNIDIANCANGAAGMFRAVESGVMRAVRPNADLHPDRTSCDLSCAAIAVASTRSSSRVARESQSLLRCCPLLRRVLLVICYAPLSLPLRRIQLPTRPRLPRFICYYLLSSI